MCRGVGVGGGVVPVISAVCECLCVQSPAPGPYSPKHHTAPAPHSCTRGPAGLHGRGVNTCSVGTNAYQIRGEQSKRGRGRTFLLRDTVALQKTAFTNFFCFKKHSSKVKKH